MGGEIMGQRHIRARTQHQPVDHPLLRALDLNFFVQMGLDGLASEPIKADDAGAMGQLPADDRPPQQAAPAIGGDKQKVARPGAQRLHQRGIKLDMDVGLVDLVARQMIDRRVGVRVIILAMFMAITMLLRLSAHDFLPHAIF